MHCCLCYHCYKSLPSYVYNSLNESYLVAGRHSPITVEICSRRRGCSRGCSNLRIKRAQTVLQDGSQHTYMPGTKVKLADLGGEVNIYMRYSFWFG